jgi:hypothetical protein
MATDGGPSMFEEERGVYLHFSPLKSKDKHKDMATYQTDPVRVEHLQ